ncbi:ZIP zinc transporter [Nonlabens xylanidelens]|uniref:ZIP zinc transporter n=1 Tax=Nonlabens xylanidelens TaxID=191564 RepID=A0A2S6ILK9_9FLAO|nr:ZIP family metal transporter [Nonlabens xylanidelens]PPK95030.1 ZIP zinc transporter [Nonlabens xylanidelens]PQJ17568.1 ZIP family metal transporter [Nonlabens xylanidelens]
MNLLLPFLGVLIGFVAALLIKAKSRNRMKLLLAFSGAFLLSAVASEFLPDIYEGGNSRYGAYLLGGVFLQIILEFFSKGAEHGHLHINKEMPVFPYLLFGSLCLHAFLEGMPLQGENSMIYGISIHKIPIAFIFTSFLLSSNYNKVKAVIILLFFAAMSPLGSITAGNIDFLQDIMLPIKAIVAGIVLHVSTTLILEASEAHKFNLAKIVVMLIGAVLGFLL